MFRIVCIGAGKLAHQLMPVLERAGNTILQIYNRHPEAAAELSGKLTNTRSTSILKEIDPSADLYFLALKDDVIEEFAAHLRILESNTNIFLHCSGILPLSVLPFKRKAIFYPLQSFSLNHEVNWNKIPILITTELPEIEEELTSLAGMISSSVYSIADEDRGILHLGAVFANNFSNHMLTLAEAICLENNVPFEILKPLIEETFLKAIEAGPSHSQTGPAIRGDQQTMEKHLQLMQHHPEWKRLYSMISESIIDYAQKKK